MWPFSEANSFLLWKYRWIFKLHILSNTLYICKHLVIHFTLEVGYMPFLKSFRMVLRKKINHVETHLEWDNVIISLLVLCYSGLRGQLEKVALEDTEQQIRFIVYFSRWWVDKQSEKLWHLSTHPLIIKSGAVYSNLVYLTSDIEPSQSLTPTHCCGHLSTRCHVAVSAFNNKRQRYDHIQGRCTVCNITFKLTNKGKIERSGM